MGLVGERQQSAVNRQRTIWSLTVFPSSSIVRIFYSSLEYSSIPLSGQVPTYEVNTDSRNVAFRISIICKSEKQTRLSDTGVTDEEEFEQVIVSNRDQANQYKNQLYICTVATAIFKRVFMCFVLLYFAKGEMGVVSRGRELYNGHPAVSSAIFPSDRA